LIRNNDLGDVLVSTPLIHGLRHAFPDSHISIGAGDWARSILENNPDLNCISPCNAPWHNKQNCQFPANSPLTFLEGLLFIIFSQDARDISKQRHTHGIDVLGSRQGSWLLRRAGIPHRYGVRGYAGGDKWCEKNVNFREDRNVTCAALAFLPLLGASIQVDPRPRIYLTERELGEADLRWEVKKPDFMRVILAPGGGFPQKCWGDRRFTELTNLILSQRNYHIGVIGSDEDKYRISLKELCGKSGRIRNFCGNLSIRQSAALVAQSDFVITNSSLAMHLAGAFQIPSLTLLGECYDSAILHHKQWGYKEGLVKGKETSSGTHRVITPKEAFKAFTIHSLQNKPFHS